MASFERAKMSLPTVNPPHKVRSGCHKSAPLMSISRLKSWAVYKASPVAIGIGERDVSLHSLEDRLASGFFVEVNSVRLNAVHALESYVTSVIPIGVDHKQNVIPQSFPSDPTRLSSSSGLCPILILVPGYPCSLKTLSWSPSCSAGFKAKYPFEA
ncbi:MAG: hypothetical protein CM1200mP4_4140 [Rhodospirillaceae bacterium]|nr:MAG: hypothetical protein CM1200mP4_4140 [Rhodospirillaceae bacterium]